MGFNSEFKGLNTGQKNACKQNSQQKELIPNRDIGVGNGRQPSAILDILDNWIYSLYAKCYARTRNYM